MSDLYLFNIGFRCENICDALKEYESGNDMNVLALQDSVKIIHDCLLIKNGNRSFFGSPNNTNADFLPLLFDYFNGQNIDRMVKTLDRINKVLNDLSNSKKVKNTKEVQHFFEGISDLCLREPIDNRSMYYGFA